MTSKIGRDYILNEDELKLMLQSAFVFGYQAERNKDYGKLGWEYACKVEKKLDKDAISSMFSKYTARLDSKGR